jgi:hypothetical protein
MGFELLVVIYFVLLPVLWYPWLLKQYASIMTFLDVIWILVFSLFISIWKTIAKTTC